MLNPSEPAMPSVDPDAKKGDPTRFHEGLTVRAYIAARVAQGLAACPFMVNFSDTAAWFRMTPQEVADRSVAIADAVIERLNQ